MPDPAPTPAAAAMMHEKARCAGIVTTLHSDANATLLLCPAWPHDISLNRAFGVDAREVDAVARLAATMRAGGRRALLETHASTIGDAERETFRALGLTLCWRLITLRAELVPAHASTRDPGESPTLGAPTVRRLDPSEASLASDLAVRAFGFEGAMKASQEAIWQGLTRGGMAGCYVADLEGIPSAIGLSWHHEGVAIVDGAATVPEGRRRGCQTALIAHRMNEARRAGARWAITRTTPESPSRRNLERAGFVVYRELEAWGDP